MGGAGGGGGAISAHTDLGDDQAPRVYHTEADMARIS